MPSSGAASPRTGDGLLGRVALVTGGGRGLGPHLAGALAAAGAAIAVTARTGRELDATVCMIESAGGRALAVPGDVTSVPDVDHVVTTVEATLGPIDVLVNNAGLFRALGPLWEVDADDWWRELEVDLRGPMLCSRAVLPGMVARRAGCIVNIASGAATGPLAGASAYGAAKTALVRVTDTLAHELEGTGVVVFALDPGFLRTPMNEDLLRTRPAELERWAPWFPERLAAAREDSPEAAAQLTVILAERRADSLTGRFLSASDDIADLVARAEEIRRRDLLTLRLLPLDPA